jgi:hypothetical protein
MRINYAGNIFIPCSLSITKRSQNDGYENYQCFFSHFASHLIDKKSAVFKLNKNPKQQTSPFNISRKDSKGAIAY